MSEELVWVADSSDPIVAIMGSATTRPVFIRQPKQILKSQVDLGMDVLDERKLRTYLEYIKLVKARQSAREVAKG